MKNLLVIDGNSIANRAYYGLKSNLSTRAGLPTAAVFGFIGIVSRELERLAPCVAVAAFDVHAPTFRHRMFEGYKGTRKPMDEALCRQMPYIVRAAEALGMTVVEKEGYEADDILGTYSAEADADGGYRTCLLTGDRDSFQLISGSTYVRYPSGGEYTDYDPAAFRARFGVEPEQYVDVKAVMGDSSDNIPGVPGIGEKGAVLLISKFGSLDAIYRDGAYRAPGAGLKPAMISKLESGYDSAVISRELATICRSVPDIPELSSLGEASIDRGAARKLFTELEFSGYIKKFGLDRAETRSPCAEAAPEAGAEKSGCAPSSCTFDPLAEKGMIAVSYDGAAIWLCAEDGEKTASLPFDAGTLNMLAEKHRKLVFHDAKSFFRSADAAGVRIREPGFDVMLAAYVIDPQLKPGLFELVNYFLDDIMSPGIPEAVYVMRLYRKLSAELKNRSSEPLFRDIEMPLSDILTDMEEEGFRIDTEGLARYGEAISAEAEKKKREVFEAAGYEFNLNSPKQLGEVLFVRMGIPSGKKNSNGFSTSAEILEKLAPFYPIVSDILEYRKLTKLVGTYVEGLLKVADANGFVHTCFRQTGTATGRLSSAEPNLQNIPIRTDEGRELRRYFLPREGHVLIDADYSQIELRLLAAISGDRAMTGAFASGVDIHTSTASAVFGVSPDEVTPELRKRAKAVNFGIVYGIGEYSLSQDLGITVKQAGDYIKSYLAAYPGVGEYLTGVVRDAKEKGYTETLCGRRRYIPELSASNANIRRFGERVARNSPIQGSAADIIKIAMIRIGRRLAYEGLDARLVLQIHDELVLDSAPECADRAAELLKECMEGAIDLPVKLTVDMERGSSLYF